MNKILKSVIVLLVAMLSLTSVVFAATYGTTYNPFSGKLDYVWSNNQSGTSLTFGNITADYFVGDGSGLTGISVGVNGTSVNVSDLTVVGDASVGGNVTASYFLGDGSALTGVGTNMSNTVENNLNDNLDFVETYNLTDVVSVRFQNSSGALLNSPAGLYLRVGDAGTTGHSLAANDDLLVSGKLEVDGVSFFDSLATLAAGALFNDDQTALFGSGSDASFEYDTAQTPDTLVVGVSADSRGITIIEKADSATDFARPLEVNPTVWLMASSGTANWLGMQHDQTDAVFASGNGSVKINPADGSPVVSQGDLVVGDNSNYELFSIESNGTSINIASYQSLPIRIESSNSIIQVPTATNISWDNGAHIGVNSTCLLLSSPDGSTVTAVCNA